MTRSMTAFGRKTGEIAGKNVVCEIRSVNSRYLDLTVKLSRAYSHLEEKATAFLRSKGIARGKVELYIGVETPGTKVENVEVNREYAAAYLAALRELRDAFSLPDDITVGMVARNPDVFRFVRPEEDEEKDWETILSVLDPCVDAFLATREREGERLKADLMEKKARLRALAGEAKDKAEENARRYEEKFRARLTELMSESGLSPDPARLLTEVAIYVDKTAVDEELVRLESHFKAFDELFESDEPKGRKLDFLLQEMNREVNTLGSKSMDTELSRLVVEMKSELEKIREQIQNIE